MTDSPLARLLVPLMRRWWLIAGVVVVAALVTLVTMPDAPPTAEELAAESGSFRATHLLIRNEEAPSQLSFDLIRLLAGQGDLTNRIADAAGDEVSVADVAAVTLSTDPNTATMSVTAVRPTPEQAEELATLYATELVAFLDERTRNTTESEYERVSSRVGELQTSIDELQEEIESLPEGAVERQVLSAELEGLLSDFSELRSQQRALEQQRDGMTEGFVTLEPPSAVPATEEAGEGLVSTVRLPGRLWLRLLVVGVAAALGGVVLALGLDFLDTRVWTRREVEASFGLPVLAELPRRSKRHIAREPLPAATDPGGVTAEILRSLRLSLSLAPTWRLSSLTRVDDGPIGAKAPVKLEREPRSMVVTSPLTGDGKSTLVANLAVSLAEGGKRVLVVDCDFRRPAVGALLEVYPGPGLRELAHASERPLRDLASPTVVSNVAMVRSGSRGVTPSWFMADAKTLVDRCLEMADVVIFDAGPINLTNEASTLLPHVDTSLLVVRAGRVATDQARGTVEQLTQVGAHVSGIVLVGSESRRRYGYGYYTAEKKRKAAEEGAVESDTSAAVRETPTGDVWLAKTPHRLEDASSPGDPAAGEASADDDDEILAVFGGSAGRSLEEPSTAERSEQEQTETSRRGSQ